MSTTTTDPLEVMIRELGEAWLLDYFASTDEALGHLRGTLATVAELARRRGGDPLDEETLILESARNPHRVRAFLQMLGGSRTPEVLLAVWRISQGMTISEIRLEYRNRETFSLVVVLSNPYEDDQTESFESNCINDAALFRHLGAMTIDDRPIFDGIYPLRAP